MRFSSRSRILVSLLAAAVCVADLGTALAQDPGCAMTESDPAEEPNEPPDPPAQCFAPGPNECSDTGCVVDAGLCL